MLPVIPVKNVNSKRRLPDYEIKRVRGGAIIVSSRNKTKEMLTTESLKALKGVPLKLRFDGLSRAQIGSVLETLENIDTKVAYVKPIMSRKSEAGRRKIYFDTVIEKK